jgi:RNA polymerase sigma factor (TIGR02999 family)
MTREPTLIHLRFEDAVREGDPSSNTCAGEPVAGQRVGRRADPDLDSRKSEHPYVEGEPPSGVRMSVPSTQARTTSLLRSAESGAGESLDRLVPLLYQELKRVARRQLAGEDVGQTLQTTEVVHEAYLRLVDQTQITRHGRAYFFAAAARAMRQVLIDRARRRQAVKRGGGKPAVDLDEGSIAVDAFADGLVDLDAALEQLGNLNPRQARVVECRYFGGMSVEQTAEALGISPRTVKSDWALARAWLYNALRGAGSG